MDYGTFDYRERTASASAFPEACCGVLQFFVNISRPACYGNLFLFSVKCHAVESLQGVQNTGDKLKLDLQY